MPPGIDALPAGALRLNPIAARSARIARRTALGNDALKPELIAMIEQDLAVRKRLDLFEERHPRLGAEAMQVALALRQRQAGQIDTVLMQQIEHEKHQLAFV